MSPVKRQCHRTRAFNPWPWLLTRVLLPCLLQSISVHGQPAPASPYSPRHSSGSTIANNTLYIISGTTTLSQPSTTPATASIATAETLALPLTKAFSVGSAPWRRQQAGYFIRDARVIATLDQKHLILSGVLDQPRQLVAVYEVAADRWMFLPATAASSITPQTPRTMSGLSLDHDSGRIFVFGGMVAAPSSTTGQRSFSLSSEMDVLDVRTTLPVDEWAWAAVVESQVQPPAIVQPIQHYIPHRKATVILGGASSVNLVNGTISQYNPFNIGYLVTTKGSVTDMAKGLSAKNVQLFGSPDMPTPRIEACTAVLANGDLFMYGGTTSKETLHDAWVLNTRTWTWSAISIDNLPNLGRAGSTCQMATANQIIVVGGYTITPSGTREFVSPQVAIINTDHWIWTLEFIPGPPSPSSPQIPQNSALSTGAIVGIVIGCCVFLGVAALLFWKKVWQKRLENHRKARRKRLQGKLFGGTHSSEPLVQADDELLRDHHYHQHQHQHQYQNYDGDMSPDGTVRSDIPIMHLGSSSRGGGGGGGGGGILGHGQQLDQGHYGWEAMHPGRSKQSRTQEHQRQPLHQYLYSKPGMPIQSPVVVTQLPSSSTNDSTKPLNARQQEQQQRFSKQVKKPSSPFLIIPYVPDDSAFSTTTTTMSTATTDSSSTMMGSTSSHNLSSTLYDTQSTVDDHTDNSYHGKSSSSNSSSGNKNNSRNSNSNNNNVNARKIIDITGLPESARMSHTLADMQRGQYVKTLQHHKQYERRRQEQIRNHTGPVRSGTQETFIDGGYYDGGSGLDLATAVINLREVDVGEESIATPVNGVEAGTILLSSHLETTHLSNDDIAFP
ncbi:hypothetical protein BGZ94_002563 [Podila epigama]|nr:hypothetical protein BGZ94_002563 [Podila epigama]